MSNFSFLILCRSLFPTSASQPEISKYCAELMPLLLGYLSSLNEAKVGHVTKAFYALENFMENLGELKSDVRAMRLTQLRYRFTPSKNLDVLSVVSLVFLLTGADIEPYLPTLMETMLSALNNAENLKIKELAVSAIGAIGKLL